VDIHEGPQIAKSENMHRVPLFVIYRKGEEDQGDNYPSEKKLVAWVENYIDSQIEGKED
jgi:hypothetical protein